MKVLKHPNILHFVAAWLEEQVQVIVIITEELNGGSIRTYLDKIQ